MHAIRSAHGSLCATDLMHVKNSMCHFCLLYLFSRTLVWRKWKKYQKHQIEQLIFFLWSLLTFCLLEFCTSMYEFRKKGKLLVNNLISLAYIKHFSVSLCKPWQNNLSNPKAFSEPCQTSKVECFAKRVNGLKHPILDVWKESWICLHNLLTHCLGKQRTQITSIQLQCNSL